MLTFKAKRFRSVTKDKFITGSRVLFLSKFKSWIKIVRDKVMSLYRASKIGWHFLSRVLVSVWRLEAILVTPTFHFISIAINWYVTKFYSLFYCTGGESNIFFDDGFALQLLAAFRKDVDKKCILRWNHLPDGNATEISMAATNHSFILKSLMFPWDSRTENWRRSHKASTSGLNLRQWELAHSLSTCNSVLDAPFVNYS